MPRRAPEDPVRRARRRRLQTATPRQELCVVPGCFTGRVTEDCCYEHSIDSANKFGCFIENDGVVDDHAIDLVRRGVRTPKLTWVEFEIAAAYILADGHTQDEMRKRTGVKVKSGGSRMKKIEEMAHALRSAA